jgi:hypothetical protein
MSLQNNKATAACWLANSTIQNNLRMTAPNILDPKDPETRRELTDADVRQVVVICDDVFRTSHK